MTGEPPTGTEAAAVELINEPVPFDNPEARVKEIADKLACIPLPQLQAQRLTVNQAYENMAWSPPRRSAGSSPG
jgi:enoyl-CoA hydratase